jgi:hypothetical protein
MIMSEGYKVFQSENIIKKTEKRKLTTERFKKIVRELAPALSIHQDHNLLLDIRDITPHENFGEVLDIIIEISKYYYAFPKRIAVVVTNEPGRIARTKFFKAGLMPGNYQFEYFTDYERAVAWLT